MNTTVHFEGDNLDFSTPLCGASRHSSTTTIIPSRVTCPKCKHALDTLEAEEAEQE